MENAIINQIQKLRSESISLKINQRLQEFKTLNRKGNNSWFSELCFCILTANAKSQTACTIQQELGYKGFMNKSIQQLRTIIRRNKHRFHNTKAGYITEARKFSKTKDLLKSLSLEKKRIWLVNSVKGIGFKEASHFLRNVGYFNFAILDRHILNLMHENKMISEKFNVSKRQSYKDLEHRFNLLAQKLSMKSGELDMYMWYIKTGKVLK